MRTLQPELSKGGIVVTQIAYRFRSQATQKGHRETVEGPDPTLGPVLFTCTSPQGLEVSSTGVAGGDSYDVSDRCLVDPEGSDLGIIRMRDEED